MELIFGDSWWQDGNTDWVIDNALVASAAAAFTSAFVLGVGDRHQDNMMVSQVSSILLF